MDQASLQQVTGLAQVGPAASTSVITEIVIGTDDPDLIVARDGAGNMHVIGKDGDDRIYSGPGDDRILGGEGADFISAGAGDDHLAGDEHADTILGGGGNDRMFGGGGDDVLSGEDGGDLIFGGTGRDFIEGEAGDDSLFGDGSGDWLYGGAGDDILLGGAGDDVLDGGSGNDTFVLCRGDGKDTIQAPAQGNRLPCDSDTVYFIDFRGDELDSVTLRESAQGGHDLVVRYGDDDELIVIGQVRDATSGPSVGTFRFLDHQSLSAEELLDMYSGAGGTIAGATGEDMTQAARTAAAAAWSPAAGIRELVLGAVGRPGWSYDALIAPPQPPELPLAY